MKVRTLEKTLRSTAPGEVPDDLRDRLIEAIPSSFGPVWAGRRPLTRVGWKWAGLAVAASLVISAFHLSGGAWVLETYLSRLVGTRFGLISIATAEVARSVESAGALYLEIDQRTREQESFEFLSPKYEFLRIRIWLERPSERFRRGRMRIEKDARRRVFNGDSTLHYFTRDKEARFFKGGRIDYQLADPARWVEESLSPATSGVSLDTLASESGRYTTRLTVTEKGQYPQAGREPMFIGEFDRRTVISWDARTRRLTGFERYITDSGREVLATKLHSVVYRDAFEDEVFSMNLPDGVTLIGVADPNNRQYSTMEPEEVARIVFDAWVNRDWEKVRLFCEYRSIIHYMEKNPLASFKVTGRKFKWNLIYPGQQIPYELIFKDGKVRKGAIALRNDNPMKRYVFDGGL